MTLNEQTKIPINTSSINMILYVLEIKYKNILFCILDCTVISAILFDQISNWIKQPRGFKKQGFLFIDKVNLCDILIIRLRICLLIGIFEGLYFIVSAFL